MNDNDIVIVSVGMCTSVGLNAKQTAANVLAGVSHFGETPFLGFFGNPFTVAVIPRDALPVLPEDMADRPYFTRREGLLLRLGSLALKDCLDNCPVKQMTAPELYLSLPEHENTKPLNPSEWLADFSTLHPKAFDGGKSNAKWRGRAGGLLALKEAISALNAGKTKFALVGGVDTFHDTYILVVLSSKGGRRVKIGKATDYFIPGEGAGFLLITTHAEAKAGGLPPLAVVATPSEGFEEGYRGSEKPYLGEGLASTVSALFESSKPAETITEVLCTMNGESYWTKEWGVTQSRNASAIDANAPVNHPADCFGDIGAASGPVLLGLAALGIADAHRKPPCLVYASSDFGPRSATIVSAAA